MVTYTGGYPTSSPSPSPPNPHLSRKPTLAILSAATYVRIPMPPSYGSITNESYIPPLNIPFVAPCPSIAFRPPPPVNIEMMREITDATEN